MSKKVLKVASFGIVGGGKKSAPADPNKNATEPTIAALTPEETRARKLLRKPTIGLGTTPFGTGYGTSSTLGG